MCIHGVKSMWGSGKLMNSGLRQPSIQLLALVLISNVTLGKSLEFPEL